MRPVTIAAAAILAAVPVSGRAGPVSPSSDVFTADATIAAPPGATVSLAGPGGLVGGTQEGPITVTLPYAAVLSIAVSSPPNVVGDVFEVIGNGVPLGTTSHVPYNDPSAAPSSGTFVVATGPGVYTIGVWDYILSYIGFDSPYGGFVDPALVPSPAQFTVDVTVPEPATAAVMSLGLLGLFGLRRRCAVRA